MTLIASDSGGDFEPAPEGSFVARCVQLIDIGNQYSPFYEKTYHKILLLFELPTEVQERDGGPEPFIVWKRYTLSLHQNANLRKHLESWRGRAFTSDELAAFDVRNVVEKTCMVNIVHDKQDKGTYANIQAIMPVMKGVTVPDQCTKTIIFDVDEFDQVIFDTFSDSLKKTIEKSAERHGAARVANAEFSQAAVDPEEADCPF